MCFPYFPGLLEIDAHVIAWGRDSASLEADDLRLADGIKYLYDERSASLDLYGEGQFVLYK